MKNKTALLVLDLINDIVHPDGQYAAEGYLEQVRARRVLENAASAIAQARSAGIPVIYVVVGFSENYAEWAEQSPVLAVAKDEKRLMLGTWATQVHADLKPARGECVVVKHRISPFYQTNLDLLLRRAGAETLLLSGVSSEFVVLATAMAAHDRDFRVVVLEDAIASSSPERHAAALLLLGRIAQISTVADALPAAAAGKYAQEAGAWRS
jgi:nicotinamidase-related amidase